MKIRNSMLVACAVSAVALGAVSPQAHAAPIPGDQGGAVSQDQVTSLQSELEAAGITPTVEVTGDGTITEYALPSGTRVVTTEGQAQEPGTISTRARVGFGNGVYFYLTNLEQKALLATGSGAFVAGVCALSAGTACTLAGFAGTAAAPFLAVYGPCSDGRELEVNLSYSGTIQSVKCL